MKKFLLFVAAISLAAFSASADQGLTNVKNRPTNGQVDNHVVNGSFEDPAYVSNGNPYFESYPLEGVDQLEELPGWTLSTGGCWNGICQINEQEADDYMIFEGNDHYLQMHNCTVNGWTRIKVSQLVEGLTAGKLYRLDFYVAHSYDNSCDWADPTQGFRICDKPLPGEEVGQEMFTARDISEDSEYEYYIFDFTAASDAAIIELWCQNNTGEGNECGIHVVDWDEVRVYDPYDLHEDGIESIVVDFNAPVEYYTLQGVRVPANSKLNGVYIAKQGKKATKVVF